MNNIKIEVSGNSKVGKTGVIFLLKEFFKEKGFELDINTNPDYRNEEQLNTLIGFGNNSDEVSKLLNKQSKIILEERHDRNI